jgi:site-specific DNA-methyltransferase (adenine-specific)
MKPYYTDGKITIYHGDCVELMQQWCSTEPPPDVDLVWTDPPYSSGARRDADRQVRGGMLRSLEDPDWFSHDTMTSWGFSWFVRVVLIQLRQLLAEGCHLYLCIDWRQTPTLYGMLEATGFRVNHCLVWDKAQIGMGAYWRNQHENIVFASHGKPKEMGDRSQGSVLRCSPVSPLSRLHPTEKPIRLVAQILAAVPWSCVLDPFMGSGPVLLAAKEMNRRAIGIEIEERYCELAAKRLSQEVLAL